MFATIHWGRVVIGGVLSELGVIAVLLISIALYVKPIAPGISAGERKALGERVGYYVAPAAGFVTTALAAFWASRVLDSGFIANGLMVGVISVVITVPFSLAAKPEHRFMYGVAFVLRLAAGYIGGVIAQSW
jgi:hypothetical protein